MLSRAQLYAYLRMIFTNLCSHLMYEMNVSFCTPKNPIVLFNALPMELSVLIDVYLISSHILIGHLIILM